MWQQFKLFTDYTSRLSALLSMGKNNAQVAILKPKEYGRDKLSKMSGRYFEVYCEQLIKAHIDFNIIDDSALQNALAMDQKLIINDNDYKLLILPPLNSISYQSALNIFEFVEDGGQIVGTLFLPTKDHNHKEHKGIQIIFSGLFQIDPKDLQADLTLLDNTTDITNKQIDSNVLFIRGINPEYDLKNIRETLSNAIKPYVSLKWNDAECEDITFTHRTSDDFDIFFFSNNSMCPREVQMSLRCDKAPHTINLETGIVTALANCTQIGSRTMLLHRFESYGSLILYFCNEPALAVSLDMLCEGESMDISDNWDFHLHNDNFLPLTKWLIKDDTQITEFNVSALPVKTLLVFQRHNPDSSIKINGEQLGINPKVYIDTNFTSFDFSASLVEGNNVIEINNADAESQKTWLAGEFKIDNETDTLAPLEDDKISNDWSISNYPYFSGTASYKKTIDLQEMTPGKRIILCVEKMRDIAEFFVNDENVGTKAWAPYTVDITNSIKSGKNDIEIRITNTMANMIQGKVVKSGILGDVRIFIR